MGESLGVKPVALAPTQGPDVGQQGKPCQLRPWGKPHHSLLTLQVIHPSALHGVPSSHHCPHLQSSDPLCLSSGRVLCSVTQGLEKLQVLNGKENWREP